METRLLSFALNICLLPALALAGQFNEKLDIGDAAPVWKNLPGVDGKTHSLDDFKDKQLVIVVFTCNSCDVATDYEQRIIDIANKYAGADGKTALVAINVNKIADDSLPKMKERAEKRGFPFPYLFDESQKIAKDFGAVFTPEVFVLDRERRIAYMGGIDDTSKAEFAKEHHLATAIEALLKGEKPKTAESAPIGCRIRYVRVREE